MSVAGPAGIAESTQRSRILAAALTLVSETGAAGTSMRRLASACGLNVATIYHYFPSKADLLRALVEEQRYGERMASDDPPLAPDLPARQRFVRFFAWVVGETLEEETVLRLLVGEGMHGNAVARSAARDLLAALDATLTAWLADGFPEVAAADRPVAARLVRRTLLSVATEHLATGHDDRTAAADDLAAALFG
ncbi:MAG TPA: helix-turn-helix domain-containing protein [Acidimicrobiales bacterium]|nr:helix-turn-helix domain-containing protein [Acidimicrobiales bacterium]